MAVYTKVTQDELIAFLKPYDLGELVGFDEIAQGVENTNYLLRIGVKKYILTLFEKRVNEAELPFFVGLMDHLAQKGMACPVPLKRNDGSSIGRLAQKSAIIVSFLDGAWVSDGNSDHCYQVGKAMAQMHVYASDFIIERGNGLAQNTWHPLFKSTKQGADEFGQGLVDWLNDQLDELQNRWPHELPRGVIHGDLFPDNVFFNDNQLSGVIDFYFACNEGLAYDLAIAINAWCFGKDGAFDVDKSRQLIAGYQSVRSLNPAEISALPVLAKGAAMRFFLTRLYDWINTPEDAVVVKKDPREYLNYLRFHAHHDNPQSYGVQP